MFELSCCRKTWIRFSRSEKLGVVVQSECKGGWHTGVKKLARVPAWCRWEWTGLPIDTYPKDLLPFCTHNRSCARIHLMFDSNSIVCTICEINWSENVSMTERPEYMQSSYIGHSSSAWCFTHEPAPGPRRIGLWHRKNHQKRGCAGSTASWYCSCSWQAQVVAQ